MPAGNTGLSGIMVPASVLFLILNVMQTDRFRFLSLLFLLLPFYMQAQDKERLHRSLAAIKDAPDDTNKVLNLDHIAWDTSYDDLADGLKYGQQALALAEELQFEHGIVSSCNTIGTIYADMGDLNKALEFHLRGMQLSEKCGDWRAVARSELNTSIVYTNLGEPERALQHLLRSKQLYLQLKETEGLSAVYHDLGNCYLSFPDSVRKAIDYFREGLKLAQGKNKEISIANNLSGLGRCYGMLNDTLRSDEYMNRAITTADSVKNDYVVSQLLVVYASLLTDRGHYTKAEQLMMRALGIYTSIGMREQQIDLWKGLADIYEKTGQPEKALAAWMRFSSIKDSVMNENVLRHQRELEALYENEKKENEIHLLTQEQRLQRIYVGGLIAGVLLLAVILLILFNRNTIRRRSNRELERQNAIIEEKNRNITDSINYARRIQEALIPEEHVLKNHFTDAFVLFKPRDIVSGDFWWFTEKDGEFLLAAADCTGHGVPGGFMSVMSAAFLSEIVNEKGIADPAMVLSGLRLKVINALKQAGSDDFSFSGTSVKDGVDIVFCRFSDGGKFSFCCANNPAWIVRGCELIEFPADKFPVGIHHGELQPFTPQQFQLQKGDMIYLFSDGYADQFGGPQGKKFKYRQLKDLLLQIAGKSAREQKELLDKTFQAWQGNLEQVDDVLVVGLRY
jgi:tetratricopeptide (TPR) repeat protein